MNSITINALWYSISEQHADVQQQDKYSTEKHLRIYAESMTDTNMLLSEFANILKTGKQPSDKKRKALLNAIASASKELVALADILPTVSDTFHSVIDLAEFAKSHGLHNRL